jgi:hypothetical protein
VKGFRSAMRDCANVYCISRLPARSSPLFLQSQLDSTIDMRHQKLSSGLKEVCGAGVGIAGIGVGAFRLAFTTIGFPRFGAWERARLVGLRDSMTIAGGLDSGRRAAGGASASRCDGRIW